MARSNNLIRQVGLFVIVGLIVLAFVFVFGQPSVQRSSGAIAEVDGESISRSAWLFYRGRMQANLGAQQDNPALEQQLDVAALDQAIRVQVMSQAARAVGLVVHDEEIVSDICDSPFVPSCDAETIAQIVRLSGFGSERQYTDWLRRDLLVRKLTRLVASPIRVSEPTAREVLERDRLELRLRYAAARADELRDQVDVDRAQAQALAEAEPERVAAAYERRRSEFEQPERVRARHILLRGDSAQERAQELRERIDGGEDFVVLATEYSEDEATRSLGGDLGTFPRGRMQAPFEEAVFAAEARSLVGPVETESGVHLIRVEEKLPAFERTLEQVSEELAAELLREDRSNEAARAAAEQMALALRGGMGFDEAASAAGLALDETLFFRPSAPLIPGIGRVPGLRAAALGLSPENPVSDQVFGSDGVFYLISLAERREVDAEALAADLEPRREQLERQARERVLSEWYRTRREQLERDGALKRYPFLVN